MLHESGKWSRMELERRKDGRVSICSLPVLYGRKRTGRSGCHLGSGHGWALFPQRLKAVLSGGVWSLVPFPLLPGYVFVYSNEERAAYYGFSGVRYILRTLTYADTRQDVLIGRDREFADWLWEWNGCVGALKVLKIGDRVEIADDAFRKLGGRITRIDRRRKAVRITFEPMSLFREIWLAYEWIEGEDKDRDGECALLRAQ